MDLFDKRIEKEKALFKKMGKDKYSLSPYLVSENGKTGRSVNFSYVTCEPDERCRRFCYGLYCRLNCDKAISRTISVSLQVEMDPKETADRVYYELLGQWIRIPEMRGAIRYMGTGDLVAPSVEHINHLAAKRKDLLIWLYSRKAEYVRELRGKNIVVNFDVGFGREVKNKRIQLNYVYLREGNEKVPKSVKTIFPVKQKIDQIPADDRDCPCDRGKIELKYACLTCKRCLKGV